MKRGAFLIVLLVWGGCAGNGTLPPATSGPSTLGASTRDQDRVRPSQSLHIDISNVLGASLRARVDLMNLQEGEPIRIEVAAGTLEAEVPAGSYRAYVHVYDHEVPVLAEIRDLEVRKDEEAFLLVSLLEGTSGALTLRGFDADGDLAIDRVELASGTNPYDAAEIPGRAQLPLDIRVLNPEPKWYRGELHAYSRYGRGTESVAQLARRAERAGLDFLAITDLNTVQSVHDPAYKSDRVVLIPAMEWGTDEMGTALIYGFRTVPEGPASVSAAQAECIRVQAQGGIYAIGNPCFPNAPWRWGLGFVNAVEVWCRGWTKVPPFGLNQLDEELKIREGGKLVHSIAAAAALSDLAAISANAQAAHYWDCETLRGLMACALAGSSSASPKVPLGAPITYVYAREQSLPAILEGLRLGRTTLSCAVDGPRVFLNADVLADGKMDVGIGGVVPLGVDVMLEATVLNGKGKKLQVLCNGRPIRTVEIANDNAGIRFVRHPEEYSVYRARVIGAPPSEKKKRKSTEGLGDIEVFAMCSPIYAQDITQELLWRQPNFDPAKTWIRLTPGGKEEAGPLEDELTPPPMPPQFAPDTGPGR